MKIHVLGCGSALPTLHHNNAAQVVEADGHLYLIDCGEGTQIWLRRSKIAFSRLSAVFISHLHGDHCFGLIGLIASFTLLDRKQPLHIYAPVQLETLLRTQIKMFCSNIGLAFDIVFHAVDTTRRQVIFQDDKVSVLSLPLDHRMPCSGFIFREQPKLPHIDRQAVDFYKVPDWQLNSIKQGNDFITDDGQTIPYTRLTKPAEPPRCYAYCSDTKYMPELHKALAEEGVQVLYHEATYADDRVQNAEKYYHSTASQAATVARDANVERLYIGHYSQRYNDEQILLQQAQKVFPNTFLTDEKQVFTV